MDVNAFWLASKWCEGFMSTKEKLSYEQVYLWKPHNGAPMTMAALDHRKEKRARFDKMIKMVRDSDFHEAEAAFVAWMPHSVSKFQHDKRQVDKKIASLRLRQRLAPKMTAEKRKRINVWANEPVYACAKARSGHDGKKAKSDQLLGGQLSAAVIDQ